MNFVRKSVGAVTHGPLENELYVYAARFWPRWLDEGFEDSPFHAWDKELAPSTQLLNSWNDDTEWTAWEDRYVEEIGARHIRERAEEWANRAAELGKDTVVFVCFEGEDQHPECHTWTILDVLENERQSGLSRFA